MIRVDLSNFKSVFLERVRVHKEYILEKLEHQLIDEIKKLDKAYEEMRATLNKVPESEEILVELKAYTAHLDNLLDELDKTYKLQGRYYVFLEDHFH
jgi:DNA-binding transcriptional regulator GbsR (MarR family)